ncbi:MAG: hypothetical protein ABIH34_08495 [Nanoarchaeota archaeon]
MVNKKGFMRTLEAFIAVILTLTAVTFLVPSQTPASTERTYAPVLSTLLQDEGFRGCALQENVTCLNASISPLVLSSREYLINITEDASTIPVGLPGGRIDTETLFFSGNETNYLPKIVRLYTWIP